MAHPPDGAIMMGLADNFSDKSDLPPQNRSMLNERIFDTLSVRLPNLASIQILSDPIFLRVDYDQIERESRSEGS